MLIFNCIFLSIFCISLIFLIFFKLDKIRNKVIKEKNKEINKIKEQYNKKQLELKNKIHRIKKMYHKKQLKLKKKQKFSKQKDSDFIDMQEIPKSEVFYPEL